MHEKPTTEPEANEKYRIAVVVGSGELFSASSTHVWPWPRGATAVANQPASEQKNVCQEVDQPEKEHERKGEKNFIHKHLRGLGLAFSAWRFLEPRAEKWAFCCILMCWG